MQKGILTYTCSQCGYAYTEEIPTTDHTYKVTATVAATCTAEGYDTYTCAVCGDTYNRTTIPAKGHRFTAADFKDATCEQTGYYTYTCADCGETMQGEAIPAKGHTFVANTVAATCTEGGYTYFTCEVCGENRQNEDGSLYKTNLTNPVAHIMNTVSTSAPTCGTDGEKVSVCAVCGYEQKEAIPATGNHPYDAVITTEASCTEKGLVTYTCSVCAFSYTEQTPALGHDWRADWSCGEDDHWHDCTRCAEVNDKQAHSFGTKGDARFTCTVCGYVDEDRQAQAEVDDTKIAKFVADGKTVEEVPFQIGTVSIENPPVPEKDGYTGEWPFYRLGKEDILIRRFCSSGVPSLYCSDV